MNKFIKIIPALMLFVFYPSELSSGQERILFEYTRPIVNQPELEPYFQDLSSVLEKENSNIFIDDTIIEEIPNEFNIQDIETAQKDPAESNKITEYNKYNSLEKYINGNTLLESAFMQLDKPYKYGKTGPDVFDCSGFTQYVFKISGITIPRTSEQQSKAGENIDKTDIKPGDLIFFDTRNISNDQDITDQPYLLQYDNSYTKISGESEDGLTNLLNVMISTNSSSDVLVSKPFVPEKVTHVGIYIGDNKFIHASSGGQKVMVSDVTSNYYKTRFLSVKRYD